MWHVCVCVCGWGRLQRGNVHTHTNAPSHITPTTEIKIPKDIPASCQEERFLRCLYYLMKTTSDVKHTNNKHGKLSPLIWLKIQLRHRNAFQKIVYMFLTVYIQEIVSGHRVERFILVVNNKPVVYDLWIKACML